MALSLAVSMAMDLARRHWRLIAIWAALFAVTQLLLLAAASGLNQLGYLGDIQKAAADVAIVFTLTRWAQIAILGLIAILAQSVAWASAFRIILRSEDRGYLALGPQEAYLVGAAVVIELLFALLSWPLAVLRAPSPQSAFSMWLAVHGLVSSWSWVRTGLFLLVAALGAFWEDLALMWAFQRAEIAPLRCWRVLRGQTPKIPAAFLVVVIAYRLLASYVATKTVTLNHGYLRFTFDRDQIVWSAWLFDLLAAGLLITASIVCQSCLVAALWRASSRQGATFSSMASEAAS